MTIYYTNIEIMPTKAIEQLVKECDNNILEYEKELDKLNDIRVYFVRNSEAHSLFLGLNRDVLSLGVRAEILSRVNGIVHVLDAHINAKQEDLSKVKYYRSKYTKELFDREDKNAREEKIK